jgi:hypothetical protein
VTRLAAALLLALLAAAPAAAQGDAARVARAAAEQAERGAREGERIVVEQSVSGFPVTLRLAREGSGSRGRWAADAQLGRGAGALALAARDLAVWQLGLPALLREHADRFRLLRVETVAGRRAHVLSAAQLPAPGAGGDSARATLWIDTERLVPLRVELRGTVVDALGRPEPVATTMELADHRPVGGALLPFRSVVRMERTGMLPPRESLRQLRAGVDTLLARPSTPAARRESLRAQGRMLDAALHRGVMELEIAVRTARVER